MARLQIRLAMKDVREARQEETGAEDSFRDGPFNKTLRLPR